MEGLKVYGPISHKCFEEIYQNLFKNSKIIMCMCM